MKEGEIYRNKNSGTVAKYVEVHPTGHYVFVKFIFPLDTDVMYGIYYDLWNQWEEI